MHIPRQKPPVKEISMVPLINVVFLLLIFFLVAGTVEKFDIVNVELPIADSGQALDEGHLLVLLGKYDEIIIADELIAASDSAEKLKQELLHNKDRIITIKADQALSAIKLIAMMDEIKAAGGKNISLITQTN